MKLRNMPITPIAVKSGSDGFIKLFAIPHHTAGAGNDDHIGKLIYWIAYIGVENSATRYNDGNDDEQENYHCYGISGNNFKEAIHDCLLIGEMMHPCREVGVVA